MKAQGCLLCGARAAGPLQFCSCTTGSAAPGDAGREEFGHPGRRGGGVHSLFPWRGSGCASGAPFLVGRVIGSPVSPGDGAGLRRSTRSVWGRIRRTSVEYFCRPGLVLWGLSGGNLPSVAPPPPGRENNAPGWGRTDGPSAAGIGNWFFLGGAEAACPLEGTFAPRFVWMSKCSPGGEGRARSSKGTAGAKRRAMLGLG